MTASLAIALVALVFLVTALFASAAPWLPAWKKDTERILKLAAPRAGQKFFDLGCGDGRIVCAAAKTGALATGLELSLFPFILAKARALLAKNSGQILFRDLFRFDLSQADIVYFFLTPPIMPRLRAKLETELRAGTKVISYAFAITGWTPSQIDTIPDGRTIYVYLR
jgi:SAM-dependent methyltransferase